jgi:hypothetical protein
VQPAILSFVPAHRVASLCLIWFVAAARSPEAILWRDPGPVEKIDLAGSAGEPVSDPKPSFTYVREDLTGTQPKMFVRDANGVTWNVKFGFEAKPESFCWRILKAAGYFVEPSFFVASGRIVQLGSLRRRFPSLAGTGDFRDARFQYRDPHLRFQKDRNWSWSSNPFTGTKELDGLKVLLMLLSNYDNKDGSAGPKGGPNTAIFETSRGGGEAIYAFTDWGSAMGRWGDKIGQTDWDCAGFTEQTPLFVSETIGNRILFGYEGHVPHFKEGITVEHVRWLLERLDPISDDQIRRALRASGANPAEELCFAKALRTRIKALQTAVTRAAHRSADPYIWGSEKKNVEPRPTADSTQIRPPCPWMILRHIARPMPFPG